MIIILLTIIFKLVKFIKLEGSIDLDNMIVGIILFSISILLILFGISLIFIYGYNIGNDLLVSKKILKIIVSILLGFILLIFSIGIFTKEKNVHEYLLNNLKEAQRNLDDFYKEHPEFKIEDEIK